MNDPIYIPSPDTQDYNFNGHAGIGPSGAHRWMRCTGSPEMSRAFLETLSPEQMREFSGASIAARQGTTAHAAAEAEANMMLGRISQAELDATRMELAIEPAAGEELDADMTAYVAEYTDLIQEYARERGNDAVLIEARVSAVVPLTDEEAHPIDGSADCIVLPTEEHPTLVVADLKFGIGEDVTVDENPQLRIYGLGALGLLADDEGNLPDYVDTVTYHIVQPRLGGIKTWEEPIESLLEWRDENLSAALALALAGAEGGATLTPSEDACQWCPARGACSALAESRVAEATELFDAVTEAEFADGAGAFPETSAMDDATLGKLYDQVRGLMDLAEDLKAEAQRRLHRGHTVPGFKLVGYQPPRRWMPDAEQELGTELPVWKPKLLTPTQALKVEGLDEQQVELLQSLIETPDKRPVIAPDGDRRKEWAGTPAEEMFGDLPEGS